MSLIDPRLVGKLTSILKNINSYTSQQNQLNQALNNHLLGLSNSSELISVVGTSKDPVGLAYSKLKLLGKKIKGALNAYTSLEKGELKKKAIKPTGDVEYKHFKISKGVLSDLDRKFYVGKNSQANQLVFNLTKGKDYCWYHAVVQGGGLVAKSPSFDLNGAALALIYSKYLSTHNSCDGWVTQSNDLVDVAQQGSFIFKNPQSHKVSSCDVSLFLTISGSQYILSFFRTEGSIKLNYVPSSGERFTYFKNLPFGLSKKGQQKLGELVPYRWDLKPS